MDLLFPILFYVIGFIFLSMIFQRIRERAEKRCDGITYFGQINFFSQCTVVLENERIAISSDYTKYNEIRYEYIKRILPITFLTKIILLRIQTSVGKKNTILLNINAPDLFLQNVQSRIIEHTMSPTVKD